MHSRPCSQPLLDREGSHWQREPKAMPCQNFRPDHSRTRRRTTLGPPRTRLRLCQRPADFVVPFDALHTVGRHAAEHRGTVCAPRWPCRRTGYGRHNVPVGAVKSSQPRYRIDTRIGHHQPVPTGQVTNYCRSTGDSQAQSPSSILVTRSMMRALVGDQGPLLSRPLLGSVPFACRRSPSRPRRPPHRCTRRPSPASVASRCAMSRSRAYSYFSMSRASSSWNSPVRRATSCGCVVAVQSRTAASWSGTRPACPARTSRQGTDRVQGSESAAPSWCEGQPGTGPLPLRSTPSADP